MSLARIVLAPPERRELRRRARKRSLAVELVKRAEVILLLAAGHTYREVRQRLDCGDEYIREWKKRFQEERLAGLDSRYRGSPRRTRTAERLFEKSWQLPGECVGCGPNFGDRNEDIRNGFDGDAMGVGGFDLRASCADF